MQRGTVIFLSQPGDQEAEDLARVGPADAGLGGAPRGSFGGCAALALDPVTGPKPAYPRYNRRAGEGLRPLDPRQAPRRCAQDRGRRVRRDG